MKFTVLACGLAAWAPSVANAAAASVAPESSPDLPWREVERAWHQQAARIIDHRFTDFATLEAFAKDAKQAGVSALMLVQIQKTESCPGSWYNGLQLCDHINGENPAADGTLEQVRVRGCVVA